MNTPHSFAIAAFDLTDALQVSWKATTEGLLDEHESRFAPDFYIAHKKKGSDFVVWREDEEGKQTRRISSKQSKYAGNVVGTIADLVNLVALSLVPLNDGDDLHFVLVTPKNCARLRKLL